MLERKLGSLRGGSLRIEFPDGRKVVAGSGERSIEVTVRDYRLLSRVLLHGEVGLGEAYCEGLWDTPDIVEAAEVFLAGGAAPSLTGRLSGGPFRLAEAVAHSLRSNTLRRSKENIVAHYDEGNDFFRAMLGPSMTYSCAVFGDPEEGLEAAQERKLEMIANKTGIRRGERLLDIGCGFGSFALHAVRTRDCLVDACTLSPGQAAWARQWVVDEGLEEAISLLESDYRTLPARGRRYGGIASIGMYEHVGRRHQGEFWRIAASLLEPGGRIALQTIVRTSSQPGPVSWIQKHVFPGGYLPALPEICAEVTATASLRVVHAEEIGPHYATTLRAWRQNLEAALGRSDAPSLSEPRRRHWTYFLSTCEAAFRTGAVSNYQLVVEKR